MGYLIVVLLIGFITALIYLEAVLKDALHFIQSLPFIMAIPFDYTAHLILFIGIFSAFSFLNKKYKNYRKKQEDLKPKGGYIYISGNKFYKDAHGRIFDSYETFKKYTIAEAMEIERERKRLQEAEYWEEKEKKEKGGNIW